MTDRAAPGFRERPEYRIDIERSPKRVRAVFSDATVADSTRALLLRESGHAPVYYFPRDDVRMELLRARERATHCPFKGDARYWSVTVGERNAADAAWSYEEPFDEVAGIARHIAFYWDRMDSWLEEDEQVSVHPRDPYVRIDIRESRRPVRVEVAGEVLAETERARFLFETGQPTRYYIPPEDVRTDLLVASDTESACPYKGSARHYSARLGERTVADVAWSYPMPLPEARRVTDYVCFYPERVDRITVDGEPVG